MRRCLLLVLVLAGGGCAHVAARAPTPKVVTTFPGRADGESIDAILAGSGLSYVTVEPARRWVIGFAREGRPPVLVEVVKGDVFTMVMGRLGTAPPHAGAAFFRRLARRNFDVAQLKLGLDGHDMVYASFELPSRIVDRQELLEDVFTLAKLMGEVKASLFGPDAPATPAPEAPAPAKPGPPPAPIIEASRP